MLLHVMQPWVLFVGTVIIGLAALYRWYWYKAPCYVMPYVAWINARTKNVSPFSYTVLLFIARFCALLLLLCATAQIRNVDEQSKITIDGSDIMLVLDVSGSMQLFDDLKDQRSRFSVAQQEIMRFIMQRQADQIGLIVFGGAAISRCPLTLDKKLLHEIVSTLQLGDIDAQSTVLGYGLSMAVNRLRHSKALSKIIIVLTDGVPTENDISLDPVISLAQKYGIKIYTIGVGSVQGGYAHSPFQGIIRYGTPLDEVLLQTIAQKTGGAFFLAEKPHDVQRVYAMIDQLEKTSYDAPMYSRYYDLFMLLIAGALLLLSVEIIIRYGRIIV